MVKLFFVSDILSSKIKKSSAGELGEFISELLKVVLVSLVIILPIRHFIVKPFYVKGASMQPTFEDHEYLLIDEISYRFNEPQRGEVVVFKYPLNPKEYFIKRVVGLPGDTVKVAGGRVSVERDGEVVLGEELYLPAGRGTNGDSSVVVPADEYFLMGDNRSASLDSRSFGTVAEGYIVGRVWLRAWPFDRFSVYGFDDIPGLE